MVRAKTAAARRATARRASIIPRLMEPVDIFLRNRRMSSRASEPRMIITRMMRNVVVLMPPPVDAGEAPMYIRSRVKALEGMLRLDWITVSKPAVLGVTDWKMEANTFWDVVRDTYAFPHSKIRY